MNGRSSRLALALLLVLTLPLPASAETVVQTAQKWGLIGPWSLDCSLGYIIAALGAIAIAAPSMASAETVVIRHGDHHYGARAEFRDHRDHGWHRHHADRVVIVKHRHMD